MRYSAFEGESGFTLVEILIVLVIVGISIGLVQFNAMPGDRDVLQDEAVRLSSLIEIATNEARASGRTYACLVNSNGYHFQFKREDGQWIEATDEILRPRAWPEGLILTGIDIDGQPALADQRILFSSSGYNSVFSIRLAMGTYRVTLVGSLIGRVSVL